MPTGSSTVAPAGHQRLLAVGRAHRVLVEVAPAAAQPLEDRPDPLLQRRVERQRAPAELRHDLGRQVVGGRPEAAAGDDQVERRRREEVAAPRAGPPAGRRRSGSRATSTPSSRSRSDSHGPLRSRDDPREHLGAGDEDAGARAHAQAGRPGGSRARAGAGRAAGRSRPASSGRARRSVLAADPHAAPAPLPNVTRKPLGRGSACESVPGLQVLVVDQRLAGGVATRQTLTGPVGTICRRDTRRRAAALASFLRLLLRRRRPWASRVAVASRTRRLRVVAAELAERVERAEQQHDDARPRAPARAQARPRAALAAPAAARARARTACSSCVDGPLEALLVLLDEHAASRAPGSPRRCAGTS